MPIYLDNNATTKPLAAGIEAMIPLLAQEYANPSSLHRPGRAARERVERAREQVAGLIGARPKEIVFTSGGTESINLAIRGIFGGGNRRQELIISAVEHSAVRRLADRLEAEGCQVVRIGVDASGLLDLDNLDSKITDSTSLISIMHANNETGVIFDVEAVCEIAQRHSVPVHLDAVQSAGKLPLDVRSLPVNLMSISGHKMHGPKGVGALFIRRRTRLRPLMVGGGQERGLRPGTENVPAIVGFGVAADQASRLADAQGASIRKLRDEFERIVTSLIPIAHVIGEPASRLPNTSNIGFAGLQSEIIVQLLSERGVYASAGAACGSGSLEPSHVLQAMAIEPAIAHGAVRFSLSRFTTDKEIHDTVEILNAVITRLRAMAPTARRF